MLVGQRGRPVARGYVDPTGPLSFRACTTHPRERLDDAWAAKRLERAVALRASLIDPAVTTGYRLLNGEGDGAPGLVCDVYGDTAVIRLDGPAAAGFWDSAGVAAWLVDRVPVITRVYERERARGGPRGWALIGEAPDEPVPFQEHGLRFTADVVRGQKTGFFLDQRENRARVRALAAGRRTLNMFGYTGGFSVYAAAGGAPAVTTVDLAAPAIAASDAHMALNGFEDRHEGVVADAFSFLDDGAAEGRAWDLVVLDPPSFAPSRKAAAKAIGSYERLIAGGARVTSPGGLLIACSCSSHVSMDAFTRAAEDGVGKARRRATVLGLFGQPADHPTPLPMADFRYLKVIVTRVD